MVALDWGMLSVKPWRLESVIWFCAAQLASLFVGLTIIAVLEKAGFAAFQPPAGSGAVLVGTLAFQGMTWVWISLFLRQHRVNWRDAFGLHRTEMSRALLLAVPVVIAFLPLAWWLQNVSVHVLTKFGWQPENETAVTVLTNAKALWLRAYLSVFTVAVAPVAEEFIFRGMLYPFLKQCGWPRLAWFGVSFAFALIHWDAAAFVPLFLLALMLTWLYEKTDTLLAPIMGHMLFNFVNLILLLLFQNEFNPGQS
ncbi:MAG TPA: type II CAAX endopeptidase family protein [Candidatus Saccharimonadales bacterium]|nr:type II CAAX endopeptidase family protein [Candidatus Saccharimonadales bacterium]